MAARLLLGRCCRRLLLLLLAAALPAAAIMSSLIFTGALHERTPHHAFVGPQHWKANATVEVQTLAETSFARCQVHSVQVGDGRVITDWLWFDEREHVNVLVRQGGRFVLFEQTKYGIDGMTLAPVGGFIETGEAPQEAAKREVAEELGLRCKDWRPLGAFVTAANRGGGRVHTFFADECVPSAKGRRPGLDLEAQSIVRLNGRELLAALQAGRLQEVKWTATVALALLSIRGGLQAS